MQRGEDGKRHPIAYFSTTLTEAERNYDIYDLEYLAIVKACRNWRPFIAGSPHKIIVHTDHANLQYWRQPHKISRRIAREVLELSEFDIELRHIPGKSNGRADALSRRPDYDQGERDNEDVTVLPDHMFARTSTTTDSETRFVPRFTSSQDEETLRPWIDPHNLKKLNGEWWKEHRRVVTGNQELRHKIIYNHHDLVAFGHPGISRTTELVARFYWWPNMAKDVQEYVKGCAECQRHKINTQARKAPLSPITPVHEALPFQTIALDFIVKLPVSNGFNSILTITDHDCTKMAIFIPCNESISAEGVADLYLCKVFPRFGLPSKVISDRDPRFISKFMRELCRLIGATQNMSTAYHPRTDGQSERSNQWLGQYLRPWVNVQMDNWEEHLPIAEFAHNSWKNETTHYSPFKMLMGYEPRAEISDAPTPIPILELRRETWKRVRKEAEKHIIQAQQRWAQSKKEGRTFKEGEYVWLEGRNLHLDVPSNKLAPKRHGPFPIKRVLSPITYQLTLPGTWKIHDVFHVDLLTPYIETEFHGPNYTRPPPDLVQGTEEYEVEAILDSRRHGRGHKVQYLVKWKGYPNSDNEWVNWKDMHADEALEEFRQRNPSSVTHKTTIRTAVSKLSPLLQLLYILMSSDATALQSTVSDTPSEGRTSPASGAEELVRNSLVATGLVHVPTSSDFRIGYGTEDATRSPWFEPSSWRTPSPTPSHEPSPSPPELTERSSFTIPQTLIPADFVRRTVDAALSWEAAYGPIEAALTHRAGTTPFAPTRSLTPSPHSSSSSPLPIPYSEPTIIPPPVKRQHSVGALSTNSRRTSTRSPVPLFHPYPKKDSKAKEVHGSPRGTEGRGDLGTVTDTDGWTDADTFLSWEDQANASPPIPGFRLNCGRDFIPCQIQDAQGNMWPAKWTRLDRGDDTYIAGIRAHSPNAHSQRLRALPSHDLTSVPTYLPSDLYFFEIDHPCRFEIDDALVEEGDHTLGAEVRRYRAQHMAMKSALASMKDAQARYYHALIERQDSIRHLEGADALERIMNINGTLIRDGLERYKERSKMREGWASSAV
jgi:hypothetical protein